MSTLSSHVLDTTAGKPAKDLQIILFSADSSDPMFSGATDDDGRLTGFPELESGGYTLVFAVGAYFDARSITERFYEQVSIDFTAADPAAHYHVPLLLSPWGYSTYRGS